MKQKIFYPRLNRRINLKSSVEIVYVDHIDFEST